MKNKTVLLALLFLPFLIPSAFANKAHAILQRTDQPSEPTAVLGEMNFEETEQGLKVKADVFGTTAGKHGFHIHENGSCGDQGNAAGSHFNPDKAPHGLLEKNGFAGAHAGDFGNIEIGPDGKGKFEGTFPGLSLTEGTGHNVLGKSVILHAKEDDFGQPTGNAGGRIACGIIEK